MNGRTTRWGRGTAREAGRGAGPPPLPQTLRSLQVSTTWQATTQSISESNRPLRILLIIESHHRFSASRFIFESSGRQRRGAAERRRRRLRGHRRFLCGRRRGRELRRGANAILFVEFRRRRRRSAEIVGKGNHPSVIPAAGISKLTSLAHQMDNLLEVSRREESCAQ